MREIRVIGVTRAPGAPCRGLLTLSGRVFSCALGKGGITAIKHEGDGATPLGVWFLRRVLYRPDRVARPRTGLPVRALGRDDGWCDAPWHRNYNKLVTLPYPVSAEALWRADHVYDLVIVLGYNECPRVRWRGSAIFMHLARPGLPPTAGCIALSERNLRAILARASPGTALRVMP